MSEAQLTHSLTIDGRRIVLVGTAHISEKSAQLVEKTLLQEKPDSLFVELDEQRMKSLEGDSSWKNLHIEKALRRKEGMLLLATIVLSSYQRRIAKQLGVEPGIELRNALQVARDQGITIYPCDRKLQTTLRRVWRRSSLLSKLKLISALIASLFHREKINKEEVEQLKQGNVIDTLLEELAAYLPQVKNVLIDERDRYIAAQIIHSHSPHIVAVVGAGHLSGILKHLRQYQKEKNKQNKLTFRDLEYIPPRSLFSRLIVWIIPLAVIILIVLGFINNGWQGGMQRLLRWVLVNGTLAAVGCLIAKAHPLTIVSSFLAAPITSLNPTIGVGLVAGILEVTLRKPRAIDLENLPSDTLSIRGFYRNRLSHALLVFILSSVGSAIGTFVALPLLFPGS